VYAPVHDAVVLQYPAWGTMCMFGGAEPIAEMAAPRFNPQPCATDVIVTEGSIEIAGIAIQIVPLPGHTGSHTGYIANDVFFTGDILAGEEELANPALSYAYSVTKRLQSLERLCNYSCKYYVLGHGRVESDIQDLVERNIAQIHDTLNFIATYLDQGCAEANDLLAAMCVQYHIEIRNLRQYFLHYPTLHSFLSHLSNRGEIEYQIRDHRLLWCKAKGADRC
jgi:glyoxylase-like metal-dependent hydrolase (beta-lactamase superfamily II)